ncbi:MAG: NAD(P)-dependent oxidoreductase [Lachnospiraceae bacterium]|nr:NAD(P)-dependent oxidoreductase [Lachnospiraceae bacterium]
MKIVITGPTGMIGMALINKCIQDQIQVLAICHRDSSGIRHIPQSSYVKVMEADMSEIGQLGRFIDQKYDVFYHFAWAGTTGKARNDMYLQNENIKFTLDAVELASQLGCKVFIGAGSQAEYGRYEGRLTPNTPVFPENGYGMAKLCAGQMSRIRCKELGIRHIWVRILSVYGPYGKMDMISQTLRKMMAGQRAEFTPGEQVWDYLYSGDAARAMLLLAQKGKAGKVYVLGSGEARKLREYIGIMAEEAADFTDKRPELAFGVVPYGENQVMYLSADNEELCRDTGFAPEVSFREGIRNMIRTMQMK